MVDTDAPNDRLRALTEAIRASPHNLVSRRGREELGSRHIPECVAFARRLPDRGPVLDIGSGGGLPGLVVAIERPDLEVHLLESTGKKVRFLRETAQALDLEVVIHHGRAEDLARSPLAGTFPVVTARAVAPLGQLILWAAPYLTADGRLYAIKGARWREEVDAARTTLRRRGLAVLADPDDHPQAATDPPTATDPLVVIIGRGS